MKFFNLKSNRGFTLIEVMIAIAIFSIIMILGTGAVLNSVSVYKKTQTMRSVMDNLNFIMEDMSRNLRLGNKFICMIDTISSTNCGNPVPGISFTAVDGSNIIYGITGSGNSGGIVKVVDGAIFNLTPPDVFINTVDSGFFVAGEDSTDGFQPLVTIKLVGKVEYKGIGTDFNIQTSVSQRLLDF